MKTHTIIILPDGETWNTIGDCTIMVIDDKQFKELCEDQVRACEMKPVAALSFNDLEISS
jgi:hypothetical protein